MNADITSMAVWLEDEVTRLDATARLKWEGAINHANYYHESTTNGFFDGIAACLDTLANRYQKVRRDDADAAFFIRRAAEELWTLTGDARKWKESQRLPLAASLLHLVTALEIENRKIP